MRTTKETVFRMQVVMGLDEAEELIRELQRLRAAFLPRDTFPRVKELREQLLDELDYSQEGGVK